MTQVLLYASLFSADVHRRSLSPQTIHQIVGSVTPETSPWLPFDPLHLPFRYRKKPYLMATELSTGRTEWVWAAPHLTWDGPWAIEGSHFEQVENCTHPRVAWCLNSTHCYPSPRPSVRQMPLVVAYDAKLPNIPATWGVKSEEVWAWAPTLNAPFLSLGPPLNASGTLRATVPRLTISLWKSLVDGSYSEEAAETTEGDVHYQTPLRPRYQENLPYHHVEKQTSPWKVLDRVGEASTAPSELLRVTVYRGLVVESPYGTYPVSLRRKVCFKPGTVSHRKIASNQQSASCEFTQEKSKIHINPQFAGSWNLTACKFSAYGVGEVPVTVSLPLDIWESCSSATLLMNPDHSSAQLLEMSLFPPSGCDLYGCSNCVHPAPRSCGPRINQFLYGIGVSFIVLMVCSTVCIIVPWCYASWKVGSGVFWVGYKIVIFLLYGIKVTLSMIQYMFQRCFTKKPEEKSELRQKNAHRRKRIDEVKEDQIKRMNQARIEHRLLLPTLLLPLFSGVFASDCSSSASMVVPAELCQTDMFGVTVCSTGVSGEVNLVAPEDKACFEAYSPEGTLLSILKLSYDAFQCQMYPDLLFYTSDYLLSAYCCQRCDGHSGCQNPSKCRPGTGPAGLFDGWEDCGVPIHPDMVVSCREFGGGVWNDCGKLKHQCNWCVVVPEATGSFHAVSQLSTFKCSATISAQAINMEPKQTKTIDLPNQATQKLGDWLLTYLGSYELGQVWGGPTTVISSSNGTRLTPVEPLLTPKRGTLGDLQCSKPDDLTSGELTDCRASVEYEEIGWSWDRGLSVSFVTSGLHQALSVSESFPLTYGFSTIDYVNGTYIALPSQPPTITIALSTAANVTIQSSFGDVCPEGTLESLYGQTGGSGAVLIIAAWASCSPGFVSVSAEDPAVKLSPSSISLSKESSLFKFSLVTDKEELDFVLYLTSLTTSAAIRIQGELVSDEIHLPDSQPGTSGGTEHQTSLGFGLPKWAKWTLGISIPLVIIALAICCIGVSGIKTILGWVCCCTCMRTSSEPPPPARTADRKIA